MTASSNPNWAIRAASGSDLNFIYSTWLNSYRCDSELGRSTRKSVFFQEYYGVLDFILSRESSRTLVACLPDEPEVILGFLVFEPGVIHYCFTKESFRQLGIAKSLFRAGLGGAGEAVFTHKTRAARHVLKKYPTFVYNPFLLFSRRNEQILEENHG